MKAHIFPDPPLAATRLRGVVTAFNHPRGFGFIQASDGGPLVFVHFTSIEPRPAISFPEAKSRSRSVIARSALDKCTQFASSCSRNRRVADAAFPCSVARSGLGPRTAEESTWTPMGDRGADRRRPTVRADAVSGLDKSQFVGDVRVRLDRERPRQGDQRAPVVAGTQCRELIGAVTAAGHGDGQFNG